jgi:hypothetical protein
MLTARQIQLDSTDALVRMPSPEARGPLVIDAGADVCSFTVGAWVEMWDDPRWKRWQTESALLILVPLAEYNLLPAIEDRVS